MKKYWLIIIFILSLTNLLAQNDLTVDSVKNLLHEASYGKRVSFSDQNGNYLGTLTEDMHGNFTMHHDKKSAGLPLFSMHQNIGYYYDAPLENLVRQEVSISRLIDDGLIGEVHPIKYFVWMLDDANGVFLEQNKISVILSSKQRSGLFGPIGHDAFRLTLYVSRGEIIKIETDHIDGRKNVCALTYLSHEIKFLPSFDENEIPSNVKLYIGADSDIDIITVAHNPEENNAKLVQGGKTSYDYRMGTWVSTDCGKIELKINSKQIGCRVVEKCTQNQAQPGVLNDIIASLSSRRTFCEKYFPSDWWFYDQAPSGLNSEVYYHASYGIFIGHRSGGITMDTPTQLTEVNENEMVIDGITFKKTN